MTIRHINLKSLDCDVSSVPGEAGHLMIGIDALPEEMQIQYRIAHQNLHNLPEDGADQTLDVFVNPSAHLQTVSFDLRIPGQDHAQQNVTLPISEIAPSEDQTCQIFDSLGSGDAKHAAYLVIFQSNIQHALSEASDVELDDSALRLIAGFIIETLEPVPALEMSPSPGD